MQEGIPPYLVDNYNLLAAFSYAVHIYFFLGITRLQPIQHARPGLPTQGISPLLGYLGKRVRVRGARRTEEHLSYLAGREPLPQMPGL